MGLSGENNFEAADGSEGSPVLVPWRYEVTMDEASNCFKPNPLAANFDHNNHKPVTLGAVFQGAMNRVPRQTTTSKGALVWEAGIEKKVYVKLPSQCFQIASHYSLNCKTCVCVC